MNAKQNSLNALRHQPTEWIPVEEEGKLTVFSGETGTMTGGVDPWGVDWTATASGMNAAVPTPGKELLTAETIVNWRDIITIPDPATYPWEESCEHYLADVDRRNVYVDFAENTGPFERLFALMGLTEALMAIAFEPEAVADLLNAIGDQMIAELDYAVKYFNPDTYTSFDDVSSQKNTFMSPQAYRDLVSPVHKRIVSRVKELGIIPVRHCCGYAETIVEDFIDEGYASWSSVQPCNDIVGLLKRYGDRFCFSGGFDTTGIPGTTNDIEVLRGDIARCFEEYGQYEGYLFWGFTLLPIDGQAEESDPVTAEAVKYTHAHPEIQVAGERLSSSRAVPVM